MIIDDSEIVEKVQDFLTRNNVMTMDDFQEILLELSND